MGARIILLSIALLHAAFTWGQGIRIDSFPTGLQPMGIGTTLEDNGHGGLVELAATANSGDNTVSVFRYDQLGLIGTLTRTATVSGIPSPFGIGGCTDDSHRVLVTSPSDNSFRIVDVLAGTVLGTVRTGPQPYSSACVDVNGTVGTVGIVSTLGDNTLTVFALGTLSSPGTLAPIATIPNVPGSRGYHGVAVFSNLQGKSFACVAGSDAGVVTFVDLTTFRVVSQVSVPRPTAVAVTPGHNGFILVASAGADALTFYDVNTLQLTQTITGVANPQDALSAVLGTFATIGGADSVWYDNQVIPGIPGAAALSGIAIPFGSGAASPTLPAAIVTSTKSNSVFLIQQQAPFPNDFGTENGASFTTQEAPGMLASAFAATGANQISTAGSLPLPQALGGAALSIGGTLSYGGASGWTYASAGAAQAALLFVGLNQINFQIPSGIAPASAVPAQLTKPDGSTLLTTLNIAPSAPGIFTVLQNGQGQGAVLNQDNTQNFGTNPAARGSVIQIYATGAGDTNPPLMPGEPAPASGNPLILTNVTPTVSIGGQAAQVLFSGLAPGFVGLWQINAVVPQSVTPGPAVPLIISVGSLTSNQVTIAVH